MKVLLEILLLTVFLASSLGDEDKDARIIHLPQGPVRGYKEGLGTFSFYHIPYATAPTGDDKFKAPLPPPTWTEPLEAVRKGSDIVCPQLKMDFFEIRNMTQQEDCLIVNVFAPESQEDNLPVVVHFHGGYLMGYGNIVEVKNFVATRKHIAVTFNFRVGIHGFLCLGTENIPGNAGIKDQIALLRWVRKNIAYFGGNPDDVTISGASAGAMLVDLIQLVPAARGLYTKVIAESGSSLTPTTVQVDPLAKAKSYAKHFNIETDDVYDLEKFYLSASYDLLTSHSSQFFFTADSDIGFTACVERPTGDEMMLDDAPYNILKSGNFETVPILTGYANLDSLNRAVLFDDFSQKMNNNFADVLPFDLEFDSEEERDKVAKLVKEEYFGEGVITENKIEAFIDYYTETVMAYPTARSLRLQHLAGNQEIYLYEYSFEHDEPLMTFNFTTPKGAGHCYQSRAIWDEDKDDLGESHLSEDYMNMKNIMRDLWFNFITSGQPVPENSKLPEWPAMKENWSPHMSLGSPIELRGSLRLQRVQFWDRIYEKYYRVPVPPPAPLRRRSDL
ncbi:para-nitrobenzyl esterase [Amyelois transitella]|uniref:para-nitrobenzyl esterase n=1 Tax=Amyelois transitella TaxID=680683 RepID=UPI00067AAF69|nr:para-nitrobenzyl esterase [Amyelois transitella]